MHDEKCPYCKGSGEIEDGDPLYIPEEGIYIESLSPCSKCKGTGKLDWVEQVVGKSPQYTIPPGLIMGIPNGNKIPNGWKLCDGKDGTPDLTNLFESENNED